MFDYEAEFDVYMDCEFGQIVDTIIIDAIYKARC